MTFTGPLTATFAEALAQIADTITAETGWSVAYDERADATMLQSGEALAIETPTGEFIRWEADTGNYGAMGVTMGPDLNTTDGTWTDQYPNSFQIMPSDYDTEYTSTTGTDQVRYWVEAVPRGYALFIERTEGSSGDASMAFGFCEINRTWDYDTAQVREGDYAFFATGQTQYGTQSFLNYTMEGGSSGGTYDAKGQVNPDGNNDNYPITETTVQTSSKYGNAVIGTHDLWLRDNSGDRSAHQDTITEDGMDTFTILKASLPTPVALRMD